MPFLGWKIFLEGIGTIGLGVSIFSAYWAYRSERRQTEKMASIKVQERNALKIEECFSMLMQQQETDRRLEYTINKLIEVVEENKSQIQRTAAQVSQFESEAILRKRLSALEEIVNSSKARYGDTPRGKL